MTLKHFRERGLSHAAIARTLDMTEGAVRYQLRRQQAGAADGRKELVAVEDGFRESEQSCRELVLDLKARGLATLPELAVGDGALSDTT